MEEELIVSNQRGLNKSGQRVTTIGDPEQIGFRAKPMFLNDVLRSSCTIH